MGNRKIELEIDGEKAIAMMHDDLTPKACDTIWKKLPLTGRVTTAKWACREIMLQLSGEMYLELEPEGPRRVFTAPGDIGYYIRGPTLLGAQKDYPTEFQRRLCELFVYYGLPTIAPADSGRSMDKDLWEIKPEFPELSLIWAHLTQPVPRGFYLKCEANRHGARRITFSRHKEQWE